MLPTPAITCWSSNSGLRRVRRPASTACSVIGSRPSRSGSMPIFASSGSSTSTWSGSNTTTSPNVRGSTNHSSSGGDPDRRSTTCVCGGRSEPTGASSSWPLIRKCTISSSPVSSGRSRYLPRRSAARILAPVRPSVTCCLDVRRTVRSRPTSTASMTRPITRSANPRRTVSTSGSSGTGGVELGAGVGRRGLLGRLLRTPGALTDHGAVDDDGGEEQLGVVGAFGACDVLRGRAAVDGDLLLQPRLVVEVIQVGRRLGEVRPDQALDEVVGRRRATVDVHRPDDGLQRVGEDRGLLAAASGVLTAPEQEERAEVELLGHVGQRQGVDHPLAHAGQGT